MDDELKGKGENIRGRVTQAAGAITGNERTEARGFFRRLRGAIREKLGRVRTERPR